MDILLDQSSLRLGYFHLSLRNTGSLTLRMSKMLVAWTFLPGRLVVKSLSRAILVEKPRVVLVFSEKNRQNYLIQ